MNDKCLTCQKSNFYHYAKGLLDSPTISDKEIIIKLTEVLQREADR